MPAQREMRTLLTVDEAATALGTSPRFIRRLISERRIAFIKVGRHVRIAEKDLHAFITAGRVELRTTVTPPSLR